MIYYMVPPFPHGPTNLEVQNSLNPAHEHAEYLNWQMSEPKNHLHQGAQVESREATVETQLQGQSFAGS